MSTSSIRYARARFHQASELLALCLDTSVPADRQMDTYFRAHKQMGSKDRAFAAETAYGCLRCKRELEWYCASLTSGPTAEWLVTVWLLRYAGWSGRALAEAGFDGDAHALAAAIRTADPASAPFAVRANLPDWLAAPLLARHGEAEALVLAEALNRPAPVDLRVNTRKTTRAELQNTLASAGIETDTTPFSPLGLRRAQRGPLFNLPAFRHGQFELQDEGSQLLGLLPAVQSGEQVVDFCAGAGGKTLQLAAAMRNHGVVHAFDVSVARLKKLAPRLARAGLDNIQYRSIQHENDPALKKLHGRMDAVLVDAPCSGSGTLRRNPDIKWKAVDIAALTRLQKNILIAAARLVKPGGRLVYATCSLLDAENTEIVQEFLQTHPDFIRHNVADILAGQGIAEAQTLVDKNGDLRLWPHRHGTDGFYAACLVRQT